MENSSRCYQLHSAYGSVSHDLHIGVKVKEARTPGFLSIRGWIKWWIMECSILHTPYSIRTVRIPYVWNMARRILVPPNTFLGGKFCVRLIGFSLWYEHNTFCSFGRRRREEVGRGRQGEYGELVLNWPISLHSVDSMAYDVIFWYSIRMEYFPHKVCSIFYIPYRPVWSMEYG